MPVPLAPYPTPPAPYTPPANGIFFLYGCFSSLCYHAPFEDTYFLYHSSIMSCNNVTLLPSVSVKSNIRRIKK